MYQNKLTYSLILSALLLSINDYRLTVFAEVPPNLPGMGTPQQTVKETPKQAEKPTSAKTSEGSAGEYVIKGKAELEVDSEKPPLDLKVDEVGALGNTLETEKELFNKNPPQIADIKEAAPISQRSDFVIIPRFIEFRQDAVAHEFYPRKELARIYEEKDEDRAEKFAHWEFKVADANGRIFWSVSDKGMPPESLLVRTVNEKGETIRVGSPYSGVLSYWDSYGSLHTVICESFNLSGLVQKNTKGYTIYLAIDSVFLKKDSLDVTPAGNRLLSETADWIKIRKSALAPLGIQVLSRNDKLAQKQANKVTEKLLAYLKRPKDTLTGRGKAAPTGLDTHIAITVFAAQ